GVGEDLHQLLLVAAKRVAAGATLPAHACVPHVLEGRGIDQTVFDELIGDGVIQLPADDGAVDIEYGERPAHDANQSATFLAKAGWLPLKLWSASGTSTKSVCLSCALEVCWASNFSVVSAPPACSVYSSPSPKITNVGLSSCLYS